MIKTETSHSNILADRFETLHQAFVELNAEAADLQREVALDDKTSRGVFEALSRTLAFCDQLHLVLTLMREDVRTLQSDKEVPAVSAWTDQLDECIEEWLRNACLASATVH